MQVLQGTMSVNGDPLTHLSGGMHDGADTTLTAAAAASTPMPSSDDGQGDSSSVISSLASALGLNLSNQATQMLMVKIVTSLHVPVHVLTISYMYSTLLVGCSVFVVVHN